MALLKQIFVRIWLPLFFVILLSTLGDQWVSKVLEQQMSSDHADMGMIVLYGSLSMTLGMLGPLFSLILFFYAVARVQGRTETSLWNFTAHYANALSIESLRSIGKTLFWSLFFLIPGLVRFVQLIFVPLIVVFDPNYEKGEVEAIKMSTRLVNRRFFRIIAYLVVFYIALPIFMTSVFTESKEILKTPLIASLFVAIETSLEIVSMWLLYLIFQSAFEEDRIRIAFSIKG
jgi:hypothetical protein